jgi:entericidin B
MRQSQVVDTHTRGIKMKRALIGTLLMLLLALAVTGCNTVRGAGEDIESVGETMQGNTP